MIEPLLVIVVCYVIWCCRETTLNKQPDIVRDGVAILDSNNKEAVLSTLPAGYRFLDYRYSITGCSLSTFHRDVTSSPFEFGSKHPVYTFITYGSEGGLLSVVLGSHNTTPFVWRSANIIDSTQAQHVLFHCDVLHAGVMSRDSSRIAIQYKIAHEDDLPLLAELQGIDVDKQETISIPWVYEWICRKVSLLFPALINHGFTKYLQRQDGSKLNRFLLVLFGRSFYNR